MKRSCKIRILNEVNCIITGLHQDHIKYFHEQFAIFAPNYFFSPKFKLGIWDGRIRYFLKSGRTYVHLLDKIIPNIVSFGYKINLEDLRKVPNVYPKPIDESFFSNIINPKNNKPWSIRPYQVEMVNTLLEHGCGVGVAGTGSGKSLMSAAISLSYEKAANFRSIIIVPDRNLTKQTKEKYGFFGLDIGEYSWMEKDLNHTHIISTWQALKNNPSVIHSFQVVIVDECLDGDSLILMDNKTYKPIKDVNPGDHIISLNERTQVFEEDVVIKKHCNLSSSEQMYKLEFDNGITIELTGNHKVLTTEGYIRVDELTKYHEVVNIFSRKLIKKNLIKSPQNTYNLHIEKNHNYIANGIVVSNCHGAKGPQLQKLLIDHAKDIPFRFGVTGTLPKEPADLQSVLISLGPTRYDIPAHELIDQGYLANINIDIFQHKMDVQNEYKDFLLATNTSRSKVSYVRFKNNYFGDWPTEKKFAQTNINRLQWLADFINLRRSMGKGNVLCLINGIKFGKKLASMIDGAEFIYGQDPMKDREQVFNMFAHQDNIAVIASSKIASTGIDIDRIFNLMYIDLGKSFIQIIQSIGRGLRRSSDKHSVNVTDICTDLKYSKRHLYKRQQYYQESKYPHKKKIVLM